MSCYLHQHLPALHQDPVALSPGVPFPAQRWHSTTCIPQAVPVPLQRVTSSSVCHQQSVTQAMPRQLLGPPCVPQHLPQQQIVPRRVTTCAPPQQRVTGGAGVTWSVPRQVGVTQCVPQQVGVTQCAPPQQKIVPRCVTTCVPQQSAGVAGVTRCVPQQLQVPPPECVPQQKIVPRCVTTCVPRPPYVTQGVPQQQSATRCVPQRCVTSGCPQQGVPRCVTTCVPQQRAAQCVSYQWVTPPVPQQWQSVTAAVPQQWHGRCVTKCVPQRCDTGAASICVPQQSATKCVPQQSATMCVPQQSATKGVPQQCVTQCVPQQSATKCVPQQCGTICVPQQSATKCIPQQSATKCVPQQSLRRRSAMHCPGGPRFIPEFLPQCPAHSEPFANTCHPLSITKSPVPRWPACPQGATAVPLLPCQPLVQKFLLLYPETTQLLQKRVARSLPPCAPRCPEPGRLRFPPCGIRCSSSSCRGRDKVAKSPPSRPELTSGYSLPLRGVTECPPQPFPQQRLGSVAPHRCSKGYPTQEFVACCSSEQRLSSAEVTGGVAKVAKERPPLRAVAKECPPLRAVAKECPPLRAVAKGSAPLQASKGRSCSGQQLSRARCVQHPRSAPRPSRLAPAKRSGHSKKSRCASKWLW
ncbi:PREDICTED: keratinocyte proline-rich protein-like [Pseudopodoces humilis]|uniref:keratinocyte proline-rich protein-like n=1 Tax=Pseudopodoces humilis TaxID=181119 RepID=UPI0006B6C183|nr:PREDICTED: keratinocyte proline-rich protein-like [Pseudopodoces humilis]